MCTSYPVSTEVPRTPVWLWSVQTQHLQTSASSTPINCLFANCVVLLCLNQKGRGHHGDESMHMNLEAKQADCWGSDSPWVFLQNWVGTGSKSKVRVFAYFLHPTEEGTDDNVEFCTHTNYIMMTYILECSNKTNVPISKHITPNKPCCTANSKWHPSQS